jgi:hypothetical protein
MLLILKVVLQILTVASAALTSTLDYKWHDKRTTKFKKSRTLLYGVTAALLLLSIGVTVIDDIENGKKEKQLTTDLKKVQDQNDGLQKSIEVLGDKSSHILREQRDSFVSLLDDQRKMGLDTTEKIEGAADLLQSRIKETLAQQKTTLDRITGGDSFCYLRLMLSKDAAQIVVVPKGNSPLYGVHFRLWEPKNYDNIAIEDFTKVRKLDYERELGDLSPHGVVVLQPLIQLAGFSDKEFAVDIGARNGFVHELIKLVKINGEWKVGYKVTRLVGTKSRTLIEEIDPLLKGKFKW